MVGREEIEISDSNTLMTLLYSAQLKMIFLPIGGRLSVSSFSLWTPKNVAKTSVIGINIKDEQLLNSAKVLGSSVETSLSHTWSFLWVVIFGKELF